MEKRTIGIWIGIIAVVAILVALAIYNMNGPDETETSGVWNEAMVVGKSDAPNKIVEYGDYFCEFCTKFHDQAVSEKFVKNYIDTGKVKVETRPVTLLADHSPNAEQGAEAATCAADQGKFDEYSNDIIPRIKKDYFDKGIGVKAMNGELLMSPQPIEKLPQSYFNASATAAKMDIATFEDCMKSEKHKDEIAKNTERAISSGITGLPYIKVNDYVSTGFGGGWDSFELMLKAGGISVE